MFAEVVRAHRRRLGMSQEELAEATGLSVPGIGKIERGRVGAPRPTTVRQLADAFGLTGADRDRFCQQAGADLGGADAVGGPVPAQLPPDVSAFTGRQDQLAQLDALRNSAAGWPSAVVISALSGTAGVGKTALAVHWAHQVADQFPDGQLYVNLRGYDPDQPMDPGDALGGFLAGLGISGQHVPHEVDERAARYRSELAGRRMLVVLDNAGSVEQVRPLLPGSPTCLVVVTSRDRLAGLVAVHGAHRQELDMLPQAEATILLRRLVGPRVDAEPEAAARLAAQCAWLPLALRVAAELAASRPTTSLTELVAELDDRQCRLDLLDAGGDPHGAVRAVFSWSIRHLPADAASMFRRLGLHPGPDVDRYAAAAMAGTGVEEAYRRLELLVRAHLLQPIGPGRYGMHDLLRAYATELAHTHDTEQARKQAQGRLLNHYRHTASVAMDITYPYERERRPRIPPTDTPTPELSDPDQAAGWLDLEQSNLLATARHAADHGWPEHTLDLSTILRRHLRTRGRYSDAEALHHQALTTSRSVGDRTGEVNALIGLGWAYWRAGRHEPAIDVNRRALEIARATGDRSGELEALNGLGNLHRVRGRLEPAADHYRQALEIARATRNRPGELTALTGLGAVFWKAGRYEPAIDANRRALEIARATGDRGGELSVLRSLGHIHLLQGRLGQAVDDYRQALEIVHVIGDRGGELSVLCGLGHIHLLQGRLGQAADHYRRVLDLATETGNRNWQFEALHGLGRLYHTTGSPDVALAHHRQALTLATDLGQPDDQARAHDGLAHAHHTLDQPQQARRHWQQALDILISLGTDYTDDPETSTTTIRTHLATLDELFQVESPDS